VFEIIRPVYEHAVKELAAAPPPDKEPKSPDTRLVEHLVILYARGLLSLQGDDLISTFFQSASPAYTGHAMDFIGRSLNNDKETDAPAIDKFKALWDWRVDTIGGYDKVPPEELAAFAWWFASGKCGDDWAFPKLEETLKRAAIGHAHTYVLDRMDEVFEQHADAVLRCLSLFMNTKHDRWLYRDTNKGLWPILRRGVAHESATIRDMAESIVHRLGSMGFLKFREILKARSRTTEPGQPSATPLPKPVPE
jgi:hypothetical protein